jgi:nitroimidazol reductase NimA-like FMN-containing flavoprotein (pyridoxamine 5'-phosphate oxidase superfamily)
MERDNDTGGGLIKELIGRLVREQPFGVLCTQAQGQPYGSVVAIAMHDDLRTFIFATPRQTTKYRLLSECRQVSLVIDSRAAHPNDFMQIDAVTATGAAEEIPRDERFQFFSELLISRHPYQRAMVEAPGAALFRIDVMRYLYVARLQEVSEWLPPPPR